MRLLPMALLVLQACSSKGDVRPLPPASSFQGKEAVIVLHGYYGSALREKATGTRRWIRLSTLLAGTFPLALHTEELGLEKGPELEVEGMLDRFTVIPKLYVNDVYGEFLESLAAPGRVVIPFSYDWRQDLVESARELGAVVESLHLRGIRNVHLAAHSMGGLVAIYYLLHGHRDPELPGEPSWEGAAQVSSAAFFGTPFRGVASILRNMQDGTGYPWNKTMLKGTTISSFPSSYALLPLAPQDFLRADGAKVTLDISSPSTWAAHEIGLYRDPPAELKEARARFSDRQLARALAFQKKIKGAQSRRAPQQLRLFNVVGKGIPTLDRGYLSPHSPRLLFWDYHVKPAGLDYDKLLADGDGTVALSSALIPEGLTSLTQTRESSFAHDRLFVDPTIQEAYRAFLNP